MEGLVLRDGMIALLFALAAACNAEKKTDHLDSGAVVVAPSASNAVNRAPPQDSDLGAMTTGGGASDVPPPGSIPLVDYKHHVISGVIIIVGAGADHAIKVLDAKVRKTEVAASLPVGSPTFSYLPLQLGDIRGFKTMFHIYSIAAPGDTADYPLKKYIPPANGVIVVEGPVGRTDWLSGAVLPLMSERNGGPSLAILGTPAFIKSWTSATLTAPVYVETTSDDTVVPAFKAVAKGILRSLARDQAK